MSKLLILLTGLFLLVPIFLGAQVFIDPSFDVPAQVYAFKVDQAPTIDGDDADWADVPWSGTAYYNDRDYNGDGYPDPAPDRRDIQGRFKAVWLNNTNMLYLLIERFDDEILSDDATSWYHVDGYEIRVDPLNSDDDGEPGSGAAFNIGFRVGKDQHNGIEGPLPTYEAKWMVDDTVFPTRAVLELALTLPDAAKLVEDYVVGFHIYFNDTDNDDDSPGTKNACLQFWPQLYDVITADKLAVDATWANIHTWGDLLCTKMPTIHTVTGGGTGVIQDAINSAAAGDIIKVGPGEYYENIVIDKARIHLTGTMTGTDSSKIYPQAPDQPALTIAADDVAPNVTVENLCFDGTTTDNPESRSSLGLSIGSAGAKILDNVVNGFNNLLDAESSEYDYAHNLVIEGNTFYNCNGGVFFNRPNTIFRYNNLSGVVGGYGVDCKGLQAGDIIHIGFNVISDVRQCGIGWGGDGGYFTIHHNVIYRSADERAMPSREMDDGIENQEGTASTSYIYNNSVIGWDSDGMQLNGPSSFFVRNNIDVLNDNFAFDIRDLPDALDADFNIGFQNGKGIYDAAYADNFGSSNFDTDPLFVDEEGDDYALESNSPAVDAGEADPFGFKVFFAGTKVDIGAIESGVTAITSVKSNKSSRVTDFSLHQNYPNPFNPSTTIRFNLAKAGHVTMNIYDVNGRLVANLLDSDKQAGAHEIVWNANGLASGVYLYSLERNGIITMRKMLLVK